VFAGEDFGYCITMGLPAPSDSAFALDPEIKRECIWSGPVFKPERVLVDRSGPAVRARTEKGWQTLADGLGLFESIFVQIADPNNAPEVLLLRETVRSWRFYDQLRTDVDAPSRIPRLGTRTPVLGHDGGDLATAIQTIIEVGDANAVSEAIDAAFPGASLNIAIEPDGRFALEFRQPGLLRPLNGAELSDGTLHFLLWLAALLTPRPPSMMVLNEPETSPGMGGDAFASTNERAWRKRRRPRNRIGEGTWSNPGERPKSARPATVEMGGVMRHWLCRAGKERVLIVLSLGVSPAVASEMTKAARQRRARMLPKRRPQRRRNPVTPLKSSCSAGPDPLLTM
jgi:hypothetical protein